MMNALNSGFRLLTITLLPSIFSSELICAPIKPQAELSALALFESAEQARGQFEFAKARKNYIRAIEAGLTGENREKAIVAASTIDWRVFGDLASARARLSTTEAGSGAFDPLIERSRLERVGAKDYDAARTAATRALEAAENRSERSRALTAGAAATVDEALGQWRKNDRFDRARLEKAITDLRAVILAEGPLLQPALLLLRAALLAGDGQAALDGWRWYYRKEQGDSETRLGKSAGTLLSLLPAWTGSSSAGDTRSIALALADSRMFEEAAILLPRAKSGDARIDEIVAYASSVRRVEELTDRYYQQIAQGKGDSRAFQKSFKSERDRLLATIARPGKKIRPDDAQKELMARFGTVGTTGNTGGVFDLHLGHTVLDEQREVEQYGKKARVGFALLDSMVSNGYGSWAMDGNGAHGGWADATRMYQVRPAYADGPIREWMLTTDPETRARIGKEIDEDSARDLVRAAEKGIQEFPGLRKRLRRQYLDDVLSELQQSGLAGEKLRTAFINRVEHDRFESSIVAHEGRHSIDALHEKVRSTSDKEFRAKLSEVAFSPSPRFALVGGILSGPFGGDSPHGIANEKLAEGLVRWMQVHKSEIAGLDSSLPLLPQLDRMSDEQIRTAAREMDPLFKAK